jgi:hypothetical protein
VTLVTKTKPLFVAFSCARERQTGSMAAKRNVDLQKLGDQTFAKVEKIVRTGKLKFASLLCCSLQFTFLNQNSELFTLTYGAIVWQLLKDNENPQDVNTQLEKMFVNLIISLVFTTDAWLNTNLR